MSIPYRCPICHSTLKLSNGGSSLKCDTNHCFDFAKEGYVNLLPVQNKKSKAPGDSADMIQARRRFLNRGYYSEFAQALLGKLRETNPTSTIDIGCGEGYYGQLLLNLIPDTYLCGIDISKPAVRLCAKAQKAGNAKNSQFAVASAYSLPYLDSGFDSAISVFSPICPKESARVLKPGAKLFYCGPGPNHLKQLAEHIYNEAKPHDGNPINFENEGFFQTDEINIHSTVTVEQTDLPDLLMMTPYFWSCRESEKETLFKLNELTITLQFNINTFELTR